MNEYSLTPWSVVDREFLMDANRLLVAQALPSDARRIAAAINATEGMTTEGLEEIARKDLSGRLALLSSLMMQEIKAKQDLEDTWEYPLTRGD